VHHYLSWGWKEGRDPAPWFSTNFYLKTYQDVAAANVIPFLHYLTAGRDEGRSPKQTVNVKRSLLEHLLPPEDNEFDAAVVEGERVTEAYLLDYVRRIIDNAIGLALSFSHSCYPRFAAGVELFISDEQKLFNARHFAYMHLSPIVFSVFIKETHPNESLTRITLDGSVVGVATVSEVARVLESANQPALSNRILVMHSPLGHTKLGFLRLLAAFDPTSTYYWVHDYSSVCTGYNLLRNYVEFCHAPPPDSVACTVCIFGSSRSRNAEHMFEIFKAANFTVVAPSAVALEIWRKGSGLPCRAAVVKEHCQVDYSASRLSRCKSAEQIGLPGYPVKVAFVGYQAIHKGWPAFERLVEETRGDSTYEFFRFAKPGTGARTRRIHAIDAVVTANRRDAMVELLRDHEIDIVVIPSICPETFSYVTSEALAAGCDLVTVADSGNVAATVQRTGRGKVFAGEDELVQFFTRHHAVELVRSRANQPNPCGSLVHCGTTAAIVFGSAH